MARPGEPPNSAVVSVRSRSGWYFQSNAPSSALKAIRPVTPTPELELSSLPTSTSGGDTAVSTTGDDSISMALDGFPGSVSSAHRHRPVSVWRANSDPPAATKTTRPAAVVATAGEAGI